MLVVPESDSIVEKTALNLRINIGRLASWKEKVAGKLG